MGMPRMEAANPRYDALALQLSCIRRGFCSLAESQLTNEYILEADAGMGDLGMHVGRLTHCNE